MRKSIRYCSCCIIGQLSCRFSSLAKANQAFVCIMHQQLKFANFVHVLAVDFDIVHTNVAADEVDGFDLENSLCTLESLSPFKIRNRDPIIAVNRPNRMNERAFNEFRYTEFVSNGQTEKPRSSFRFPLRRRQCRREILIGQKDRTQKDTRLIFLRSIFLPLQPPFYTSEKQNHLRPIIASLNTVAVKDKRQISINVGGTGLGLNTILN